MYRMMKCLGINLPLDVSFVAALADEVLWCRYAGGLCFSIAADGEMMFGM